jgi:hypothetical protein
MYYFKWNRVNQVWWYTPVIPATLEAEAEELLQGQPGLHSESGADPISKNKTKLYFYI